MHAQVGNTLHKTRVCTYTYVVHRAAAVFICCSTCAANDYVGIDKQFKVISSFFIVRNLKRKKKKIKKTKELPGEQRLKEETI